MADSSRNRSFAFSNVKNIMETTNFRNDTDIINSVVSIMISKKNEEEKVFQLTELLGYECIPIIERLMELRNEILSAPPSIEIKTQECAIGKLSNTSKFVEESTVNYQKYDVEASFVEKPKIQRIGIKDFFPSWAQQCFNGCETLNEIQSTVYETCYNTQENVLVCAPTGAGKTNIALLTILCEIKQHIIEYNNRARLNNDDFLIVYITPMKALATEITEKFKTSLKHLGVKVHEYTGDTRISSEELAKSQILVATPEKWDVATRKSGENAPNERLSLLIIDEIHLLQDDRGPVLEALVARTQRQVEQRQSLIRIVGLSATLPNYMDVARFLNVKNGLFYFGPEYRPVPLQMTIIGARNTNKCPNQELSQIFSELHHGDGEKDLVQIDIIALDILSKIIKNSEQQVLVFVHTRNDTQKFAALIAKFCEGIIVSKDLLKVLGTRKLHPQLKDVLHKGIGIHHAGLPRDDRIFVENSFRKGFMQILVCTATLAWGVNLPAHTVIIKGTKVYNQISGGYEDIGILDVHQMFGRAGRPQYDTSGHAILITPSKILSKYTSTLVSANPIDSKLMNCLEDFLNAEISLGSVTSTDDAMKWIRYTFWYQRITSNGDSTAESALMGRIASAIHALDMNMMVRTTMTSRIVHPTHLGQIASINYIPFSAVSHFNQNLTGEMDFESLLDCVFTSGLFNSLVVRNNELAEMDGFTPFIPILSPFEEIAGKVNFLFQTYVSRTEIRSTSLQIDQAWVADNMQRIFNAVFELSLEKGWCDIAFYSQDVSKMVENRILWCPSKQMHPLYQFLGSSPKDISLLQRIKLLDHPIEYLKNCTFNEIKELFRTEENAKRISTLVKSFPFVEMQARYQPISDQIVNIIIEAVFPFEWNEKLYSSQLKYWCFIEDGNSEVMYVSQEIPIDKKIIEDGLHLEYLVPYTQSDQYKVSIKSSRYFGGYDACILNVSKYGSTFCFYENMSPKLRPLPVSCIVNSDHRKIFKFNYFNIIQSQLFHQTYYSDDNLLLCAPTAAGKTVVAELAILRLLTTNPSAKVVYLVPLKSIVIERMKDWKGKFGKMVIELTGDYTPDSKAVAKSQIIVSTPEKWDAVSRGFIVRSFVQQVQLIVIDEIHLLGTDRGHILEALVDRMRSLPGDRRFIGLSTCLSNPLDVAKWLGVKSNGCYNFSPSLRTIPLQTYISGFPGRHYCPRMSAMNKPLYDAIRDHSNGKPVLVFVSSRRQTRLTAVDLITFEFNLKGPPIVSKKVLEMLPCIKDNELKNCLENGIGIHHAGLLAADQEIVENLFHQGDIKTLVATSTLAWGVNLPAHLVVIKGTEYFDAKSGQYIPYTITEIQQMMGRAGRPQFDTSGIVIIFCEESKKSFIQTFISSPYPVESSLLKFLPDHINAEVATGRINSIDELHSWLKRSYFGLRLEANPQFYNNITIDEASKDVIATLEKSHCINTSVEGKIVSTPFGRIGSIFYVSNQTIKLFYEEMSKHTSIEKVLFLICHAHEFKDVPVRHSEDELIESMEPRFPSQESSSSSFTKAFYIIQYYLSKKKMPIPDFETDLASVLDQSLRIVGCLIEVASIANNISVAINACILSQMLVQGVWHDENPLSAFGNYFSSINYQKDQKSLPEILLSRKFKELNDHIMLYQKKSIKLSDDIMSIEIELHNLSGEFNVPVLSPHFQRKPIQSLLIIVGDPLNNRIYCHRRVQLQSKNIKLVLESKSEIPTTCWVYLFSDSYLGIDQMYPLDPEGFSMLSKAELTFNNYDDDALISPIMPRTQRRQAKYNVEQSKKEKIEFTHSRKEQQDTYKKKKANKVVLEFDNKRKAESNQSEDNSALTNRSQSLPTNRELNYGKSKPKENNQFKPYIPSSKNDNDEKKPINSSESVPALKIETPNKTVKITKNEKKSNPQFAPYIPKKQ